MSSATRTAEDDLLEPLASGTSNDPFALLGRHDISVQGRSAAVIRV